jgi:PAS domain S-box-containing protein
MNPTENPPVEASAIPPHAAAAEMGERTRTFDWSTTPVGPAADWPQSLKTIVRTMLDSQYAMWVGWGPNLTFFYNDAYARMTLGPKHPWALGRPAREVWSEIWDDIGPRAETVMRTGRATWDERLLLILERGGFREETYHTFSYSPIPDDHANVGGLLCVVTEDTERTIGERRLKTLRELGARTTEAAKSVEDACRTAARTLEENPYDVPFALIYLLDPDKKTARLVCGAGIDDRSPAAPAVIELTGGDGEQPGWPLRSVMQSGRAETVVDLERRFGRLPGAAWPEPPAQAYVVPMLSFVQNRLAGFVVAGVSPRLVFNDDYKGFFDLLAGHIGTAVSHARAYEEERRRADALAELDRAKTVFFSNVSHEFRTPLTLMLGPVEDLLARSYTELSPSAKGQLEVVSRNGARLLRLVNTLLDFSRIEAGRGRAVYQPIDLAAFTRDLAGVFRSACERAGLRLVVDCPALAAPVYVDRDMWEKIVLNLVSNAFKFTFEGEIAVSLRPVGDAVELRVRDTGVGIPAEEIPRLFERFHRIENSRGRTHEGSGIGLALVQELVKLHGGTISAQSTVGEGATFIVSVPTGSAHLPAEQIQTGSSFATSGPGSGPFVEEAMRWLPDEGREPSAPGGERPFFQEPIAGTYREAANDDDDTRPRVLVADDNADMRQYIVRLLSESYRVVAVPDGEAAMAAARKDPPDLVLTDIMMPRLDGFGLLRALRADPSTRPLPVIMLSARAGEESRVEGMEAGADDYLIKPFGSRELLARVSAHLQMARLRREANAAIEKERDWLRVTFASIGDAVITTDAEGRVSLLNGVAEAMTGWKNDEALGRPLGEVFRIVNECSRMPVETPAQRALNEGVIVGLANHTVLIRRDGTESPIDDSAAPVRDADGQIIGCVLVFRDITARRQSEEAMRKRSEQLRHLADIATRLTAAADVSSVAGIVTEEARNLIGAHQAVLGFTIDQSWSQSISRVSLSDKYAPWRSYVEAPNGTGIYSVVCRSNAPMRLTQAELEAHPAWNGFGAHALNHPPLRGWLAAPMVARDGQNLGLIQLSDKYEGEFTADDEAVLVQLAQMASVAVENARLVESLQEADHRKDEFLATLAHELRNPLAPLRNGVQTMKLAPNNPQALEQSQSMMDRQLSHLVRLVDDLMDVSRITRGKIDLRMERVELARVVALAIETSRPLIDERHHRLRVDHPPNPIYVNADVTRLSQVFANLLTNAAKYTEPGGTITVTTSANAREAAVAIRDSGSGIPAAMLPRVFEMFTQVDHSLERSQGGLGIGLTLVKRLTEMHGGSVEAKSDGPGLGSEFTVRLPVAAGTGSGPVSRSEPAAQPAPSRRILVADDNRDSAFSLAMMLRLMGNETEVAYDGAEAVELASRFRPDVIFLDIGMPNLNGYDAARQIRAHEWGKMIVLVALTGWGQEEDRRRSEQAGFDVHMVKPVDPSALAALLPQVGETRKG